MVSNGFKKEFLGKRLDPETILYEESLKIYDCRTQSVFSLIPPAQPMEQTGIASSAAATSYLHQIIW